MYKSFLQVWVEIPVSRPEVVSPRQVLRSRYGRACYSSSSVHHGTCSDVLI
ncbi:MAG: hypothetical protein ACFFD4_14190 [Candidatus Odinarchaeota archaeon]